MPATGLTITDKPRQTSDVRLDKPALSRRALWWRLCTLGVSGLPERLGRALLDLVDDFDERGLTPDADTTAVTSHTEGTTHA